MLKLTMTRPNTVGTLSEREYDDYNHAEDFIERTCEHLADKGWELSELQGSTSNHGIIEATHNHHADTLLIEWEQVA